MRFARELYTSVARIKSRTTGCKDGNEFEVSRHRLSVIDVWPLVKFLIYPPRGKAREREREKREKERGSTARSLVRGLLVTFVGRASIERNFFRMIIVIKILRVKRRDGGGGGGGEEAVAYPRRNEQVERENGKAAERTAKDGRERDARGLAAAELENPWAGGGGRGDGNADGTGWFAGRSFGSKAECHNWSGRVRPAAGQ